MRFAYCIEFYGMNINVKQKQVLTTATFELAGSI